MMASGQEISMVFDYGHKDDLPKRVEVYRDDTRAGESSRSSRSRSSGGESRESRASRISRGDEREREVDQSASRGRGRGRGRGDYNYRGGSSRSRGRGRGGGYWRGPDHRDVRRDSSRNRNDNGSSSPSSRSRTPSPRRDVDPFLLREKDMESSRNPSRSPQRNSNWHDERRSGKYHRSDRNDRDERDRRYRRSEFHNGGSTKRRRSRSRSRSRSRERQRQRRSIDERQGEVASASYTRSGNGGGSSSSSTVVDDKQVHTQPMGNKTTASATLRIRDETEVIKSDKPTPTTTEEVDPRLRFKNGNSLYTSIVTNNGPRSQSQHVERVTSEAKEQGSNPSSSCGTKTFYVPKPQAPLPSLEEMVLEGDTTIEEEALSTDSATSNTPSTMTVKTSVYKKIQPAANPLDKPFASVAIQKKLPFSESFKKKSIVNVPVTNRNESLEGSKNSIFEKQNSRAVTHEVSNSENNTTHESQEKREKGNSPISNTATKTTETSSQYSLNSSDKSNSSRVDGSRNSQKKSPSIEITAPSTDQLTRKEPTKDDHDKIEAKPKSKTAEPMFSAEVQEKLKLGFAMFQEQQKEKKRQEEFMRSLQNNNTDSLAEQKTSTASSKDNVKSSSRASSSSKKRRQILSSESSESDGPADDKKHKKRHTSSSSSSKRKIVPPSSESAESDDSNVTLKLSTSGAGKNKDGEGLFAEKCRTPTSHDDKLQSEGQESETHPSTVAPFSPISSTLSPVSSNSPANCSIKHGDTRLSPANKEPIKTNDTYSPLSPISDADTDSNEQQISQLVSKIVSKLAVPPIPQVSSESDSAILPPSSNNTLTESSDDRSRSEKEDVTTEQSQELHSPLNENLQQSNIPSTEQPETGEETLSISIKTPENVAEVSDNDSQDDSVSKNKQNDDVNASSTQQKVADTNPEDNLLADTTETSGMITSTESPTPPVESLTNLEAGDDVSSLENNDQVIQPESLPSMECSSPEVHLEASSESGKILEGGSSSAAADTTVLVDTSVSVPGDDVVSGPIDVDKTNATTSCADTVQLVERISPPPLVITNSSVATATTLPANSSSNIALTRHPEATTVQNGRLQMSGALANDNSSAVIARGHMLDSSAVNLISVNVDAFLSSSETTETLEALVQAAAEESKRTTKDPLKETELQITTPSTSSAASAGDNQQSNRDSTDSDIEMLCVVGNSNTSTSSDGENISSALVPLPNISIRRDLFSDNAVEEHIKSVAKEIQQSVPALMQKLSETYRALQIGIKSGSPKEMLDAFQSLRIESIKMACKLDVIDMKIRDEDLINYNVPPKPVNFSKYKNMYPEELSEYMLKVLSIRLFLTEPACSAAQLPLSNLRYRFTRILNYYYLKDGPEKAQKTFMNMLYYIRGVVAQHEIPEHEIFRTWDFVRMFMLNKTQKEETPTSIFFELHDVGYVGLCQQLDGIVNKVRRTAMQKRNDPVTPHDSASFNYSFTSDMTILNDIRGAARQGPESQVADSCEQSPSTALVPFQTSVAVPSATSSVPIVNEVSDIRSPPSQQVPSSSSAVSSLIQQFGGAASNVSNQRASTTGNVNTHQHTYNSNNVPANEQRVNQSSPQFTHQQQDQPRIHIGGPVSLSTGMRFAAQINLNGATGSEQIMHNRAALHGQTSLHGTAVSRQGFAGTPAVSSPQGNLQQNTIVQGSNYAVGQQYSNVNITPNLRYQNVQLASAPATSTEIRSELRQYLQTTNRTPNVRTINDASTMRQLNLIREAMTANHSGNPNINLISTRTALNQSTALPETGVRVTNNSSIAQGQVARRQSLEPPGGVLAGSATTPYPHQQQQCQCPSCPPPTHMQTQGQHVTAQQQQLRLMNYREQQQQQLARTLSTNNNAMPASVIMPSTGTPQYSNINVNPEQQQQQQRQQQPFQPRMPNQRWL